MPTITERRLNSGLLIMRLGIAVTLLIIAVPRLTQGAPAWAEVGRDLRFVQAGFPYQVVGLTLLVVQVLASVGLITGYLFRVSSAALASVYGLYFLNFINSGYKTLPLYAGALALVCLGLLFSGPGRFAVAVKIESK